MKLRPVVLRRLLALAALALAPLHAAPPSAAFQPGDRWAAVGDSITHSGSYHEWIMLYQLTRFPDRALDLANCGISGDTAEGANRRYAWDIAPHAATVASIMLGMNDVTRGLYTDTPPTLETLGKRLERIVHCEENLRTLVATLQKSGARVILITPSIFDQTAELERPKQTGVNDALAACAEFAQKLATETGAALVDFHGPMTRLNAELQKTDPTFTLVGPDRIHPGAPGHFTMAYLFLKAQAAPAEVASLSLDAASGKIARAINGNVEKIHAAAGGLAFTWAEQALPFPIDPAVAPALAWIPFTAELNQETLQVTGLKPGAYELRIDGAPIRTYAGAELARGVNLATEEKTPQYRQALAVAALVQQRTKLVSADLRGIAQFEHQAMSSMPHPIALAQARPFVETRIAALKATPPVSPTTLKNAELYLERKARETGLIAEAARLATAARRAAQPVPHAFELVPVDTAGH